MCLDNRPVWVVLSYTSRIDPSELQIVSWPDPRLRSRATHVPLAEEVALVAPRMVELMHEASGIGLAAPQVGLPWRMFVTCVPDADPIDRVFVDPVIRLDLCGAPPLPYEEGCLSFPGVNGKVDRPIGVRCEFQDTEGNSHVIEADGLLGRCILHEVDHLNGKLFIDLMQKRDLKKNETKIKKLKRESRDF